MFLVDTNVVSELRKQSRMNPNVARWSQANPEDAMFLSVVTVMELEIGVRRLERRDKVQGGLLRDWLENRLIPDFAPRIIPVSLDAALTCASLHVPNPSPDRDALIAATALVAGLSVVTRNVSDFETMGVKVLNPWEPA
jgi:hypothetical protein